MAKTESTPVPLGSIAPHFSLPDTVTGNTLSLDELKSDKATVIMFICNHCPYVIHIKEGLTKLTNEYMQKGVSFIAISSNDAVQYPDDSPENMKKFAQKNGFKFPYLYDETQKIARAYDAACTPEFYIYDKNHKLVYHGQFDDSRPSLDIPVTGNDLRSALNNVLDGIPVNSIQKPGVGCNIKWK